MKWNYHIQFVTKKLRSLIVIFKFLKSVIPIELLRNVYFALAQSHLQYGIVAWGSASKNQLSSVNIVQKWLLKIIYDKNYRYPSDALYIEAAIFDAKQLFWFNTLSITFSNRSKNNLIPHSYPLRRRELTINVPRMHKTIGQKSHLYVGPKIFNVLPKEVVNCQNINIFKKRLKEWILGKTITEMHTFILSKM